MPELTPTHHYVLKALARSPDGEMGSFQLLAWLEPHAEFERTIEAYRDLYHEELARTGDAAQASWRVHHLAVYEHLQPLLERKLLRAIPSPGESDPRVATLLLRLHAGVRLLSPHLEKVWYSLTPEGRKFALKLIEKEKE